MERMKRGGGRKMEIDETFPFFGWREKRWDSGIIHLGPPIWFLPNWGENRGKMVMNNEITKFLSLFQLFQTIIMA